MLAQTMLAQIVYCALVWSSDDCNNGLTNKTALLAFTGLFFRVPCTNRSNTAIKGLQESSHNLSLSVPAAADGGSVCPCVQPRRSIAIPAVGPAPVRPIRFRR